MATNIWNRQRSSGNAWQTAQSKAFLLGLPAGDSILRCRFAWGFGGATSAVVSPTSVQQNVMTMGLVTTVGNGTEAVPHPISQSTDQAPPTQRWLYWSTRAPVCVSFDPSASSAVWQSTGPEEESSSKGQVLAPSNMGAGNTLNLWWTWVPVGSWDVSGLAQLWWTISILFRTP